MTDSARTEAGPFTAYIDGASRGNPGKAAYGVRVLDPRGREVARFGRYLGRATNNHAEYQGLIAALRWAVEQGVGALQIRSDSELLVRQMQGRYRVRSPTLRPLYQRARELAGRIALLQIEHVGREDNAEADSIANEVLDRHRGGGRPED